MVESTWLAEELPILEAIRRAELDGEDLDAAAVAALQLERPRYMSIIQSLEEAGYIEARIMPGDNRIMSVHVVGLRERGRRAVGQWPSEGGFDAFLALLEQRIETTQDEDEKSRLRRALEGMGSIGRQIGTDLLTAWARQTAGL